MNGISERARDVVSDWFSDGPWRSKSVLAALVVVTAGLTFWVSNIKPQTAQNKIVQTTAAPKVTPLDEHWNWSKPFPFYVRVGASYVAAYCLGWLFRRLLRLILMVSILAIAALAYGKFVGWDMTHTQEQVKQSGE
jgi:hypothetical protein